MNATPVLLGAVFVITQTSAPETPEEIVRRQALELLAEIKREKIWPPDPAGASDFPDRMTGWLKSGKVKITVNLETPKGYYISDTAYDPRQNRLIIQRDRSTLGQALSMREKVELVHELWHAYQDAARLPLQLYSEVEGEAMLLAARFHLRRVGLNRGSDQAVEALLTFCLDHVEWYQSLNRDELLRLTQAALTDDPRQWRAAAKHYGRQYLMQVLLFDFKPATIDFYRASFGPAPKKQIRYTLQGGGVIVIPGEKVMNLIERWKIFDKAKRGEALEEAYRSLMNYWTVDICARFRPEIDNHDRANPLIDGVE